MTDTIRVTDVRFQPCRPEQRKSGLRGFASCLVDGTVWIHSITVRRGRDGYPLISFPTHITTNGVEFAYVRPATPEIRAAIERAVINHVRRGGWLG